MPQQTKPEDYPAAVRFRLVEKDGSFQVTCSTVTQGDQLPYRLLGGCPRYADRDAFQAQVERVGMSPAVAEDEGRSFNATARQLRNLGFSVELPEEPQGKK